MKGLPIYTRIVAAVVLAVFISAGCSSRQVYQGADQAVVQSSDAININAATAGELERLPFVGASTAEAIVAFRLANGPFRRPEHIMQVRGISEKRFLELRHLIRVE